MTLSTFLIFTLFALSHSAFLKSHPAKSLTISPPFEGRTFASFNNEENKVSYDHNILLGNNFIKDKVYTAGLKTGIKKLQETGKLPSGNFVIKSRRLWDINFDETLIKYNFNTIIISEDKTEYNVYLTVSYNRINNKVVGEVENYVRSVTYNRKWTEFNNEVVTVTVWNTTNPSIELNKMTQDFEFSEKVFRTGLEYSKLPNLFYTVGQHRLLKINLDQNEVEYIYLTEIIDASGHSENQTRTVTCKVEKKGLRVKNVGLAWINKEHKSTPFISESVVHFWNVTKLNYNAVEILMNNTVTKKLASKSIAETTQKEVLFKNVRESAYSVKNSVLNSVRVKESEIEYSFTVEVDYTELRKRGLVIVDLTLDPKDMNMKVGVVGDMWVRG